MDILTYPSGYAWLLIFAYIFFLYKNFKTELLLVLRWVSLLLLENYEIKICHECIAHITVNKSEI